MILLHIVSDDESQIIEIADFLLKEKLILNPLINNTVYSRISKSTGMDSVPQVLLIAKTKALLFTTIDQKLRDKYIDKLPLIYSVPIVHMDWEQADELMKDVTKI